MLSINEIYWISRILESCQIWVQKMPGILADTFLAAPVLSHWGKLQEMRLMTLKLLVLFLWAWMVTLQKNHSFQLMTCFLFFLKLTHGWFPQLLGVYLSGKISALKWKDSVWQQIWFSSRILELLDFLCYTLKTRGYQYPQKYLSYIMKFMTKSKIPWDSTCIALFSVFPPWVIPWCTPPLLLHLLLWACDFQ